MSTYVLKPISLFFQSQSDRLALPRHSYPHHQIYRDKMTWPSKVEVLGQSSINIGRGILREYAFEDLLTNISSSTYALVTDTNISSLHLSSLQKAFHNRVEAQGLSGRTRLTHYKIAPGEDSKCRTTKAAIEDWLLDQGCTRDTVLLALGGGVVGDLVGFVAATYMRGIRFVQIPTTLLAMVDSSVGGKTAIDTPHGKNLIGAIWQPERIYMDLDLLQTLPRREMLNGMAEVIKTLVISDEAEFSYLERNAGDLMEAFGSSPRNQEVFTNIAPILERIILASTRTKARIVTMDENEGGLRNLLNFGHTIGHAIEAILTPEVLHGECVAIGMVKEAELARFLGVLSQTSFARLSQCIARYGLPLSLNDKTVEQRSAGRPCPADRMLSIMTLDKKNDGSTKKIVLLSAIGTTAEQKASSVADSDVRFILSDAVKVHPSTTVQQPWAVTCEPPGSKSISNRVLLLAALGSGTCKISNLLHSDDTQVMITALEKLRAAQFAWRDGGRVLEVTGNSARLEASLADVYVGNAGTASRFLTSAIALARPTSSATHTVLTGNSRMQQRPQAPLVDALRSNGVEIEYLGTSGSLPLRIRATGGLTGGEIHLAASTSSQYVSSILLCAPYAKQPVTLRLVGGKVISQPYIDMTIAMMSGFGVKVRRVGDNAYQIPQQCYRNPPEYRVESDASSATYPLAMAAMSGTTCVIPSIGWNSLQGDARFAVDVLRPMGCLVKQTADLTMVTGPRRGRLLPLPKIDMEPMTDAFLTVCALAAVANPVESQGKAHCCTRITGIANQRVKECNRIRAMKDELCKFGIECQETEDGINVFSQGIDALQTPASEIACYDDHRVAMSLAVLSCFAPGSTVISERLCVGKTWPGWWDTMRNIFKIRLAGTNTENFSETRDQTPSRRPQMSMFLIGMRGVGKSTVGSHAARLLGYDFVDMDTELEAVAAKPIPQIIREYGWSYFRAQETKLLHRLLAERRNRCIIATGGGIVEIAENRELLKIYSRAGGGVILLSRDMEDVVSYLRLDKTRPAYTDDMLQVWKTRKPLYEECSNHRYSIQTVGDGSDISDMALIMEHFANFLKPIATTGRQSYNTLRRVDSGNFQIESASDMQTCPKTFYIFGRPLSHTKSPAIHNALFSQAGLPHVYKKLETNRADDVVSTIRAPDFGGASVTMPLKLEIMSHLDIIDNAATEIGAVNTIVTGTDPVTGSKTLTGFNTDWQGMQLALRRAGAGVDASCEEAGSAVVVGGGGTARAAIFALRKMCRSPIYLVGRSQKRLADLRDSFGKEYGIQILEKPEEVSCLRANVRPKIAISTIPGDSDIEADFRFVLEALFAEEPHAEQTLASSQGLSHDRSLMLDMAYGSSQTSMGRFMSNKQSWTVVPGVDVLVAQGLYQVSISYLYSQEN